MTVLAVLLAGAAGAVLRFLAARVVPPRGGISVAVLLVNIVGSALAGVVVALSFYSGLPADLRLIIVTGFCGGLTTFSTFSVDTVQLVLDGKTRAAALNAGANLVLGVGAAALAWVVTTTLVA